MPRIKELKDSRLIAFRVSGDLARAMEKKAEENGWSLSKEIRLALVKHVKAATETA